MEVQVGLGCRQRILMVGSNLSGRTPYERTWDISSMSGIGKVVVASRDWYCCSLAKKADMGPFPVNLSLKNCDRRMKGPALAFMESNCDLSVFHIWARSVIANMNCWKDGETDEMIIEHAFAALHSNSSSFSLYITSDSSIWDGCLRAQEDDDEEDISATVGETSAFSMPWTIFHVRSTFRKLVRVVDQSV